MVLTAPASSVVAPVVVMWPAAVIVALVLTMAIDTPRSMEIGLVSASEVAVDMAVKLTAVIALAAPRLIAACEVETASAPMMLKFCR